MLLLLELLVPEVVVAQEISIYLYNEKIGRSVSIQTKQDIKTLNVLHSTDFRPDEISTKSES
jgi:hypothetical protein